MGMMKKVKQNEDGFTLVEMLAVLVIIAVLAAVAVPSMTGFIKDAQKKSHTVQARAVLVAAQTVATEYTQRDGEPDNLKKEIVELIGDNYITEDEIGDIEIDVDTRKVLSIEYTPKGGKKITINSEGVTYED